MGGWSGLIYMVSFVLNSSVLVNVQYSRGKLVPLADGAGPEAVFVFITVTLNCEEFHGVGSSCP